MVGNLNFFGNRAVFRLSSEVGFRSSSGVETPNSELRLDYPRRPILRSTTNSTLDDQPKQFAIRLLLQLKQLSYGNFDFLLKFSTTIKNFLSEPIFFHRSIRDMRQNLSNELFYPPNFLISKLILEHQPIKLGCVCPFDEEPNLQPF